jgi:hypothetical protein
MAATDTHPTVEELLGAVFSVQSVPRLYNEGQLPLVKRTPKSETQCLGV